MITLLVWLSVVVLLNTTQTQTMPTTTTRTTNIPFALWEIYKCVHVTKKATFVYSYYLFVKYLETTVDSTS